MFCLSSLFNKTLHSTPKSNGNVKAECDVPCEGIEGIQQQPLTEPCVDQIISSIACQLPTRCNENANPSCKVLPKANERGFENDPVPLRCLRDITHLLNGCNQMSQPGTAILSSPPVAGSHQEAATSKVLDHHGALQAESLPLDDCLEIFCGECPFDELRQFKQQQLPQNTVCLNYSQLNSLWYAQAYATDNLQAILNHFQSTGLQREGILLARVFYDLEFATKTAFSLECCEDAPSVPENLLLMLRDVIAALLQVGANVAIADYALDIVNKIFQPWLPPFFQSLPADVQGPIILQFCSSTLEDAPNGQISMLGGLATEGETVINTLADTRRPVLNPQAASFLRVLAVAQNAGYPNHDELVSINPSTGEWRPAGSMKERQAKRLVGTPAVIIVDPNSVEYCQMGWKGNVLLFGAHFAEIMDIGGVKEDVLYALKEKLEGVEKLAKFKDEIANVPMPLRYMALQSEACACVKKAPQHSKERFKSKK